MSVNNNNPVVGCLTNKAFSRTLTESRRDEALFQVWFKKFKNTLNLPTMQLAVIPEEKDDLVIQDAPLSLTLGKVDNVADQILQLPKSKVKKTVSNQGSRNNLRLKPDSCSGVVKKESIPVAPPSDEELRNLVKRILDEKDFRKPQINQLTNALNNLVRLGGWDNVCFVSEQIKRDPFKELVSKDRSLKAFPSQLQKNLGIAKKEANEIVNQEAIEQLKHAYDAKGVNVTIHNQQISIEIPENKPSENLSVNKSPKKKETPQLMPDALVDSAEQKMDQLLSKNQLSKKETPQLMPDALVHSAEQKMDQLLSKNQLSKKETPQLTPDALVHSAEQKMDLLLSKKQLSEEEASALIKSMQTIIALGDTRRRAVLIDRIIENPKIEKFQKDNLEFSASLCGVFRFCYAMDKNRQQDLEREVLENVLKIKEGTEVMRSFPQIRAKKLSKK